MATVPADARSGRAPHPRAPVAPGSRPRRGTAGYRTGTMDVSRPIRRLRHRLVRWWQPWARRRPSEPTRRALHPATATAIGFAFRVIEDWGRADRAFERAVRRDPAHAPAWRGLAETRLHLGPPTPTVDARLGVVERPAALPTASAAAHRLTELTPDDPSAWATLVRTLRQSPAAADAHAAADTGLTRVPDRSPGAAALWFERGFAALSEGRRVGGFTPELLDRALESFDTALACDPSHYPARFHLMRLATQHGRWPVALAAAWPGAGPWPDDVDGFARAATGAGGAPTEFWFVAAWRLQAAGRHREAEALRRRLAATLRTGARHLAFERGLDDARAALAAGDHAAVERRLARLAADFPRREDRAVVAKLAADVALRRGDAGPLRHWAAEHSTVTDPTAERRFAELVHGRRVAVVGPGIDAGDDDEIAAHDVVVRTKYLVGNAARVDIAYYSDSSAAVLADSIATLLADGTLPLAVFRPSGLRLVSARGFAPGTARVSPFEDLAGLHASHFAIARIVYDLLRYAPATITVFRADLFTGAQTYDPAYVTDRPLYRAQNFVPVTPMYGHDLAGDHAFLARLLELGMIGAAPGLARILTLSSDDYLARVEAALAPQAAG